MSGNTGGLSGMVATERRSQVDERLAEIDGGLDRVREMLDRLEVVLGPVLSEPRDFPEGLGEPSEELVPLARRLYSVTERIVGIGDWLAILADRVQV